MKNINKLILWNFIIPIVVGTLFYYFISPEVIFVKQIDRLLGTGFHVSAFTNAVILRFVRNYFLDMLWGYALVFALHFVLGNNTANLMKIFLIAFSFSSTMEFLQLTPIARGTFDVWDIIAEFLAEVIAVFIIKKIYLRRKFK